MDEKKRFQKQKLNPDDHKDAEKGANVARGVGIAALIVSSVTLIVKKDGIKKLAKGGESLLNIILRK